MNDDRKSGLALITGMLGTIITMAFHPTFNDVAGQGSHAHIMMHVNVAVHALALIAMPIIFLGALGLTRRLDAPNRLAVSALVLFGFAEVAGMIGGTASGLIAPGLIRNLNAAASGQDQTWRAVLDLDGRINQSFILLYVVSSALAIVCWSAAILKGKSFGRWLGTYGCIFGPLVALAVLSGHVRLNVHGFGLVVLVEAVWFVGVGLTLWRSPSARAAAG